MNDNHNILPPGKLDPKFLSKLLTRYTTIDETVMIGPGIGIDATVIDQGNFYLIAKTDPITFVTENIGYYTVNINANDIACMGGIPRWFLSTILLPELGATRDGVESIFSQIHDACKELDILFCGGHTEVTFGIDRPIVVGQMLGVVDKDSLINSLKAIPGDDILLTRGIAIEATSIIAREKYKKLCELYSYDLVEKCRNFIYDPGISVLKDARLAMEVGGIHAMHDPTEGGLAMGLHELATASGCGLKVFDSEIPILPESKLLCDQFNIDPLGAIASGALLVVADPHYTPKIIETFRHNQILIKMIGKMMESDYGVKLLVNESEVDMPEYNQDEITKLFKF